MCVYTWDGMLSFWSGICIGVHAPLKRGPFWLLHVLFCAAQSNFLCSCWRLTTARLLLTDLLCSLLLLASAGEEKGTHTDDVM